MARALKDGVVDAVATWNPPLFETQTAFTKDQIVTFYSEVYTEMALLVTTAEMAKEKSEACRRLLRGLARAEGFLRDHPEEAMEMVVARLPEHVKEAVPHTWDAITPELNLSNVLLSILQDEAKWFKNQGRFERDIPNFREIIDTTFLKEVKPEAVTVID